MQFPDPVSGYPPPVGPPVAGGLAPGGASAPGAMRTAVHLRQALVASLAVVAGTAVLGVAGGFLWSAVAPRAALVVTGPGVANVVNSETNAFIAADGWYCLICVAGGVISGLLGHRLAVRRHDPLAMAAVLIGALAAGLITLWIGEQSGLATFHHLLGTLRPGAHMQAQLALASRGAIAFWPLAAGLMAGSIELTGAMRERRQVTASMLDEPGYPGIPRRFPGGLRGPG
jgi:hypothetical protein